MCSRFNKSQIELGAEKHAGGLDPSSQEAVEYLQAFNRAKRFSFKDDVRRG